MARTLTNSRTVATARTRVTARTGVGGAVLDPPPDIAPTITSNPVVEAITETTALISWGLDQFASGQIQYGTTVGYGSTGPFQSCCTYSHHQMTLTGLTQNTTYHYRVVSTNGYGSSVYSSDSTFTTSSTPAGPPSPWPADNTYAAVFSGDATGSSDVGAAFASFVNAHPNQTIALAVDGVYRMDYRGAWVPCASITATGWTLDFRGARIVSNQINHYTVELLACNGATLNDPWMVGRMAIVGYGYDETSNNTQGERGPSNNEHLLAVVGGINITINRPHLTQSWGDAIYVTGRAGNGGAITVNDPELSYCGRNAISPVSGNVNVNRGHISYCAQYGIDYEPNATSQGHSLEQPYCSGIIDGTNFTHIGDSDALGYSLLYGRGYNPGLWVAAATEYPEAHGSFIVRNCTGDRMMIYFNGQTSLSIINNSGTVAASGTLYAPPWIWLRQCVNPVVSGNVNYQLVAY